MPIETSSASCVLLAGSGARARLLLQDCPVAGFWTHFVAPIDAPATPWGGVLAELETRTGLRPEALFTAEFLEQYFDLAGGCIVLTPAFVARLDTAPATRRGKASDERLRWCTLEEALALAPHPNQHALYRHVWRYFVERDPTEVMAIGLSRG